LSLSVRSLFMSRDFSLLLNYLHSGHEFSEQEKFLKFQFQFFNTMLILAILIPPIVSVFHANINEILVYTDNAFALSSMAMVLLLRQSKKNFTLASNIFIPSLFFTITIAFFLSGDDASKLAWGPILFACAFLLQGSKSGFFWFLMSLLSYLFGYLMYGEEGIFYSAQELFLTSLAYFTMNVIFSAFIYKTNADNQNLSQMNSDLLEKSEALTDFNLQLESRIDHALQENQNKAQAMQRHLNLINEHIISVSIGIYGLINNVSSAYATLNKRGKHEFIGAPFTKIFQENTSTQELKSIWKSLQEGNTYQGELSNLAKDKTRYWLDITISPEYSSSGELIAYIAIARDISDKKLILQQHEQLISQSRHAAMGEMISMIAHQWRQPLASITASTANLSLDIALKKSSDETTLQKLKEIDTQVFHLSDTIEDFRDFFKPSKGLQSTYIHLLLQEAVKLLDYRLGSGIKIIYLDKVDLCLALYKNELIQVLLNIFNNACDAFEENQIKAPEITITEYIEEEMVIIEIEDNGGGIKTEALEQIFDPYFSTKSKEGTGLGLHMSKCIIEEHHQGKLEAFNRGEGAVFKLYIPLSSCKLPLA